MRLLSLKDAHRWRDSLRQADSDAHRDLALIAVEAYLSARESAFQASDFARDTFGAWVARRPQPRGRGLEMSRKEVEALIPQLGRRLEGEE